MLYMCNCITHKQNGICSNDSKAGNLLQMIQQETILVFKIFNRFHCWKINFDLIFLVFLFSLCRCVIKILNGRRRFHFVFFFFFVLLLKINSILKSLTSNNTQWWYNTAANTIVLLIFTTKTLNNNNNKTTKKWA